MSKSLKKAALVVGVAALAFTGIGLFAIPAVTAGMTALTVGSFSITFGTLGMLGLGLVGLGTAPSLDQLLEHTGANARGQAFVDPNAEGAFVFGRTTVPLALVYEELHGINEDRVTGVMAHAWHEIEAYVSLHVEAEAITFSGDEATGDWAGLLEWRRNLGTAGQTAIAISEAAGGEFDWPSDATFEGVAHSALTWNFFADPSQNKLKGAVPSHVDMVVDAAFLYDPREDPAYGSGSQDFGTPSGWTFNNGNGVLVPLRFLIGERTAGGDLIWGRGAAEGEINLDNFAAMADVADETVDSKPRYRLGGMHLLDGNWEAFVARWEHETGGKIYKSGGIYHIWVPHDDLTPLTTITEDDLLAGVPVQSTIAAGIEGLFNTARGRYIEPTEGYKGFPYPEVTESSAITEDGGKRVLSNDFSWVQDVEIAERTARYKVRRSRFQRAWVIAMDWRGQGPNYAPFTVHTLNIKETGNDAQLVRVVARSEPQQGITVLTLQEEDASIYDDTVALGSPHASNTIPNRINRLGTLVPRTVGDGGSITFTPILVNVGRAGSKFTKTGGTDGTWDSAFYSQDGHEACAISCRASQTNKGVTFGLTTDPTADHDFDTIDFGVMFGDDGHLYVYENGVQKLDLGAASYSTNDQVTVAYDGLRVRYYGSSSTPMWVTAAVGLRLFADSSFKHIGAAVNSVTFGRITHVSAAGKGWAVDSQGKPAGVRAVRGIADRSQISLAHGHLLIESSPVTGVFYGLIANPAGAARTYQLTIRHRSSAASVDGFWLRVMELFGALPVGKTHIGQTADGAIDPVAEEADDAIDLVSDGPMPGTTAIEQTFTFTLDSGTQNITIAFGNYDPATAGVTYVVEWVMLTELGSNVDLLGTKTMSDTTDLRPNSVTDVYEAEADGPFTVVASAGSSDTETMVTLSFTVEYDCEIQAWVDGVIEDVDLAVAGDVVACRVSYQINGGGFSLLIKERPVPEAVVPEPFSFSTAAFDAAEGDDVDIRLTAVADSEALGDASGIFTDPAVTALAKKK